MFFSKQRSIENLQYATLLLNHIIEKHEKTIYELYKERNILLEKLVGYESLKNQEQVYKGVMLENDFHRRHLNSCLCECHKKST